MRKFFVQSIYANADGISLMELVIYLSIMTIMLLLTSKFAIDMIRGQRRASEAQRSHQAIRYAVALLNYDLRYAQSIDTVNSVFAAPDSILIFRGSDGSQIRYERTGQTLTRTVGAGSAALITPSLVGVESFTVQYLGHSPKSLEAIRLNIGVRSGTDAGGQVSRKNYITSITRR